jgi:hypothetical protein
MQQASQWTVWSRQPCELTAGRGTSLKIRSPTSNLQGWLRWKSLDGLVHLQHTR